MGIVTDGNPSLCRLAPLGHQGYPSWHLPGIEDCVGVRMIGYGCLLPLR